MQPSSSDTAPPGAIHPQMAAQNPDLVSVAEAKQPHLSHEQPKHLRAEGSMTPSSVPQPTSKTPTPALHTHC
jgi:hypothetical protein